ncbi:MAG: hypothetical protein QM831_24880 [Kofleriaceae bacterium]
MTLRKFALVILLAGCDSGTPPPATPSNKPVDHAPPACVLPRGWNPGDMTHDANPRVLAWISTVDDRPLVVDSALVWSPAADGKGGTISNHYRHPKDDNTWHESMIYDAPGFESMHTWNHTPTRAEADGFFDATAFEFQPSGGFKQIASGICEDTWRAAFGVAPWRTFPAK